MRQIATALGISSQQYFRIEKGLGGTRLATAEKIADLLHVELAYLLGSDATATSDPELEQLARRAAQLPEERREMIKKMLAAMLALGAVLMLSSPTWATSQTAFSPNARCAIALAIALVLLASYRCQKIPTKLKYFSRFANAA